MDETEKTEHEQENEPVILKFPAGGRSGAPKALVEKQKAPRPAAGATPAEPPVPLLFWYTHVDILNLSKATRTACLRRHTSPESCQEFIRDVRESFKDADSLKISAFHHSDFLSEIMEVRKIA
jgi:hypothetical protein